MLISATQIYTDIITFNSIAAQVETQELSNYISKLQVSCTCTCLTSFPQAVAVVK